MKHLSFLSTYSWHPLSLFTSSCLHKANSCVQRGVNVTANAAHPGAVKTELGRNFFNRGVTGMIHIIQCTLDLFSICDLKSLKLKLMMSNKLAMLDVVVNLLIIKISKLWKSFACPCAFSVLYLGNDHPVCLWVVCVCRCWIWGFKAFH